MTIKPTSLSLCRCARNPLGDPNGLGHADRVVRESVDPLEENTVAAEPDAVVAESDALAAEPDAVVAEPDAAAPEHAPETSEPPPSTEAIQTITRRTWTRGLLLLAASFVLLVAFGTAAVMIGDRLRAPAEVVALEEIQAAPDARAETAAVTDGGIAAAHWSETLGTAVLVTEGLDAVGEDETYEIWFLRGAASVSAGRFDTDETGAATVLLDGAVQEGDVITVTVEPEGRSGTGAPTSDPIVSIPTD